MIFPGKLYENTDAGIDCIIFFSEPPEVSPGKRISVHGGGGDVTCPEKVLGRVVGKAGGRGKAGVRDRRRRSGARGP